jgi:hypothetical protein
MPDAATWVLALATPTVAGSAALWINRVRMQHERRMAHFEAVRRLLAEGGDLLTAAHSDPERLEAPAHLAREYPAFARLLSAVRLQMFRSRLLLWFEPRDSIVQSWDEAVGTAAVYMGLSAKSDQHLPPDIQATAGRELNQAQEKFEAAMDQWFRVAREYLRRAAPS